MKKIKSLFSFFNFIRKEKLKAMSNEEVIKFINSGNPKMGMLNKYDNF